MQTGFPVNVVFIDVEVSQRILDDASGRAFFLCGEQHLLRFVRPSICALGACAARVGSLP